MYPITICEDNEKKLGYALGKASEESKREFKVIYLYSDKLLFYITDHYIWGESTELVGVCYPGGRITCRRKAQ